MIEVIAAIIAGIFSLLTVWVTYRLNQIHTLVNSNLTAMLRTQLALMIDVLRLKREAGIEPIAEALTAIEDLKKRISERE